MSYVSNTMSAISQSLLDIMW